MEQKTSSESAAKGISRKSMRLYLINPSNPLSSTTDVKENRWNRYHLWKPLNLLIIAALTGPEWRISIFDENLHFQSYKNLSRPDLVGITAFTSQAPRAYEIAAYFKGVRVPVVMGGIHATMCLDEALEHVDSVVTGEAESIWHEVLEDVKHAQLQRQYSGGFTDLNQRVIARHDLLPSGYKIGSIQTTRGCPLKCHFCSVTKFNGARYRQRPIQDILDEIRLIPEKLLLIVDDNLIGTKPEHITRAKDLFRAMIAAKIHKKWFTQVTINFADDDELLELAAKSGCSGVFIGLETPTPEGLLELGKRFNLRKSLDYRASVRRIQRHRMLVLGSFMIGLDIHEKGIGAQIARSAVQYGLDLIAVLFLTPLPGTHLWEQMKSKSRIVLDSYPEDWKYYTLELPVARYKQLSMIDVIQEMIDCSKIFCSKKRLVFRLLNSVFRRRKPIFNLIANLQIQGGFNSRCNEYETFKRLLGDRYIESFS